MSNEELAKKLLLLFGRDEMIIFSKILSEMYKIKCEEWNDDEPCEDEYDATWWENQCSFITKHKNIKFLLS